MVQVSSPAWFYSLVTTNTAEKWLVMQLLSKYADIHILDIKNNLNRERRTVSRSKMQLFCKLYQHKFR